MDHNTSSYGDPKYNEVYLKKEYLVILIFQKSVRKLARSQNFDVLACSAIGADLVATLNDRNFVPEVTFQQVARRVSRSANEEKSARTGCWHEL